MEKILNRTSAKHQGTKDKRKILMINKKANMSRDKKKQLD
jgi:hypothetical protein